MREQVIGQFLAGDGLGAKDNGDGLLARRQRFFALGGRIVDPSGHVWNVASRADETKNPKD
jgi:hypothetical protein